MTEDAHRAMHESLGAFVLGHLDQTETARVRAHLDGCAACRMEYQELAPLALALRDVDPDSLGESREPDALLGARIEAKIAAERTRRRRRTAVRRALVGTAASLILVATFVAGGTLGSDTPSPVPLEAVAVTSEIDGVVADAELVDHTWGLEIKLDVSGLEGEQSYTATVQAAGREYPAGEFLGVAGVEIDCNMSTSVLREDATGFTVWDSDGRPVLRAQL